VKAGQAVKVLADEKALKRTAIIEAYRAAYVASLDVQGPDSTADAVQAGAATILIAFQKAGVA
jgi:hypothetical protein